MRGLVVSVVSAVDAVDAVDAVGAVDAVNVANAAEAVGAVDVVNVVDAGRVPSGRHGGPSPGIRPAGPAAHVVRAVPETAGPGLASPRAGAGQGLAVVPER